MTQTYTIPIPWQFFKTHKINANDRMHWAKKARRTRALRQYTALKARQIPPLHHATIQLTVTYNTHRHRDPSNLMPTQKPLLDGIVDAGVIPDDTPKYVQETIPKLTVGDRCAATITITGEPR